MPHPHAPKHNLATVLDAVDKGITRIGAAKVLGCSYETVVNYCKRWQSVDDAFRVKRRELVDLSEMGLRGAVLNKDPWAIQFVLRTLGRDDGYGERIDIEVRVRQIAASLGIDPEEAVAEAQRVIRESRRGATSGG